MRTARVASSSWACDATPKATTMVKPFSSATAWFTLPSNLSTTRLLDDEMDAQFFFPSDAIFRDIQTEVFGQPVF